jgi:hypothetical protein
MVVLLPIFLLVVLLVVLLQLLLAILKISGSLLSPGEISGSP